MTESETPRTDLALSHCGCEACGWQRSREMERELNATKNVLEQITRHADATARDRDEWMTRALVAQAKEAK